LPQRKKQIQISGKGHNELLEIGNQWSKREAQLMPFSATRLKIVTRGEARARDSAREEYRCNKSDPKTNILTFFSFL
jgi:hypothetical protein